MAFQYVFERTEKKYVLTAVQTAALQQALEVFTTPDNYGRSTVSNIYFDSPADEMVIRSLEKPDYKEKFRIRCYGYPGDTDPVFLEIKKKFDGVVYKRRISLPLADARRGLKTGIFPGSGQIGREIGWVLQRYHLRPRVFLAYDRVAFFGKDDPRLRITFDTNIRSRYTDLRLGSSTAGELLLPEGCSVMEIKATGAMPMWLVHCLDEQKIYPCSFSKYGNVHKQHLAAVSVQRHNLSQTEGKLSCSFPAFSTRRPAL